MKGNIMVVGEAGVDFLPDEAGPTKHVENFARRAGGSAVNSVIGLHHLGETPFLRTRIGTDPFGAFLRETLDEHGIPTDFVEADAEAMTSLAFVERQKSDALDFTFYRHETADTRLEPDLVPVDVLESLQWLHVTGVLLATEPSRTAILSLMDRAQQAGCQVSFNPNTRPQLWNRTEELAQDIGDALKLTDVVIATPADFEPIGFETSTPETLADELVQYGPDSVFLSLDSISAYGTIIDGPLTGDAHHDGYDVDPVYPIGAVDAFTAGVIASLLHDAKSVRDILAAANAVATISTMSPGAITAFSLRRSAESLYSNPPWESE
ncbi:carbohydrate kinase family protein [Haloarcula marina]|uniref:carbohydrate kinase family protein n=1 Tax=Haloarcula marina TaxID=2961574 RepID=UPI0020B8464B|nr:sugar kinase [Halomicroarcula marina]